ncbi:four helix bundle metalloprotein [Leptospira yanagawae serovar Saopaulo str. Sao Paulo = ATCC 700523]|uniref:Four helix bundle metalloprotein n=1 Tax=Leptospira yanagawae serovar Saopaulo str. Sao Paulo = ATCC 700523 TaxID=1249483 RepID=A0A5E8HCG4_9LEPT|nr:DUF1569 domain-containing protein [Leptospira yanagawae]EOQ89131.1 four helix bundle metalloprotein [Leptospira yanagawae serovar Saopaulo str. Sao Paulo = ATCC 700523]
MKRKEFIKRSALSFTVAQLPLFGESNDDNTSSDPSEKTSPWMDAEDLSDYQALVTQLLSKPDGYKVEGNWTLGKVLSHCAQSIEYSLSGYPEMKSSIFRGSIGKIAFSVFAFKNKMNHGLEEPIPGAEEIPNNTDVKLGAKRLLQAIDRFSKTAESSLRPHFAYGELTKEEYDLAHTLHIKNHMERLLL